MARIVAADLAKLPLKTDAAADLDLFIGHAHTYVNANLVGEPAHNPHSEAELTAIELYIAAHMASGSRSKVQGGSIGQQSVTFKSSMAFSSEWLDRAKLLDRSGTIASLEKGAKPFLFMTSSG